MRYGSPIPANPDEIQRTAIDIILAKDRRAQRARRSYQRLLRLHERKLKPAVNEWLEWTAKTVRAGLPGMRGKTPVARVKSIADWKEIRARGEELIKPLMFEMLAASGDSVMGKRMVKKQERFDPIGLEAIKWTTEHTAELVVEITGETMLAIREYIKVGIDAGKSVQKIARELRPLVGLTSKDIMAVANFHEALILERPEYSVATQREMANTYARRLHRQRATTIARTETAFALTEGQRQGYAQMGITRLERVEDPDCCDICAEYSGKIYTIAEAEGVLPEHPSCEGSWVVAV